MNTKLFLALIAPFAVGCSNQDPSCDGPPEASDAACSLTVEPCSIDVPSVNVDALTPVKTITVHHDCDFNIVVSVSENNTVGVATMTAPGDEVGSVALGPGDILTVNPTLQAGAQGPFEIVCSYVASGEAPVAGKYFTVQGTAE